MQETYIIALDDHEMSLVDAGGKGASLTRLIQAGLPVPGGFIITTGAYRRFVQENGLHEQIQNTLDQFDLENPSTLEEASKTIQQLFLNGQIPTEIVEEIESCYLSFPTSNQAVAVRSSATAEDLPDASFAGQQDTYLNIRGIQSVLEAVKNCWTSLWTARAIGYRSRKKIDQKNVALAVVLQTMLSADAAGILFTANPMNGNKGQIVISASWGLGEAVVSGQVTPDTIIVQKNNCKILKYEIADKSVMTIPFNGGTKEEEVPPALRTRPVLDEKSAARLAQLSLEIEDEFSMPMDIEWVQSENDFYIVQARPITTLKAFENNTEINWDLPNLKGNYARVSITELLPNPVSPLFETSVIPIVAGNVGSLMHDLTGSPKSMLPSEYIKIINGYAYQSMNFSAGQMLTMLVYMIPMTIGVFKKALPFWRDHVLPQYHAAAEKWDIDVTGLNNNQLLAGFEELNTAFAYHLATLMGATMGIAAGSEGLFTTIYKKFISKPGDPGAATFLMGFDNKPINGEKSLFDLSQWILEQETLSKWFLTQSSEFIKEAILSDNAPENIPAEIWHQFVQKYNRYQKNYGYAVYELDFAKPLPMDDPLPTVEVIKYYMSDHEKNPHARQREAKAQRDQAISMVRTRYKKGLKRWMFEKSLKLAQTQAPLREDGLAEAGLVYPQIRRILREIGSRLSTSGILAKSDDIYWLEFDELRQILEMLENYKSEKDFKYTIEQRKNLWQARKKLNPPPQIPPKAKFMGVKIDGIMAIQDNVQNQNKISGVATSAGVITATARVIHGPEEFGQMQSGDILVAAITTPAWTPLFTMASGVVTDIGGPLSHGSIVAREYGIPAVLGTGIATKRIQSGQKITVDGNTGTITLY